MLSTLDCDVYPCVDSARPAMNSVSRATPRPAARISPTSLPFSWTWSRPSVSASSAIRSASRRSSVARSIGFVRDQPSSNARRAARTALSTSPAVADGTLPHDSPVNGYSQRNVSPLSPSTNSPSISILYLRSLASSSRHGSSTRSVRSTAMSNLRCEWDRCHPSGGALRDAGSAAPPGARQAVPVSSRAPGTAACDRPATSRWPPGPTSSTPTESCRCSARPTCRCWISALDMQLLPIVCQEFGPLPNVAFGMIPLAV